METKREALGKQHRTRKEGNEKRIGSIRAYGSPVVDNVDFSDSARKETRKSCSFDSS